MTVSMMICVGLDEYAFAEGVSSVLALVNGCTRIRKRNLSYPLPVFGSKFVKA